MKKHDKEKEYMTSLKAVSITTKYSAGGCDDSSSESEFSDSFPEPDCSDDECGDDEGGDELHGNPSPLYFLYDCEGTGGSIYKDHIVEIAAVLHPLTNCGNSSGKIFPFISQNIQTDSRTMYKQCFRVTLIQSLLLGCCEILMNNIFEKN